MGIIIKRRLLLLVYTIQDGLLLFQEDGLWLPNELKLSLVYGPQMGLELSNKVVCNMLELSYLKESIFILSKNDQLFSDLIERHDLILL
jgi:hypothetical protein